MTLTVTDNRGATGVYSAPVTVAGSTGPGPKPGPGGGGGFSGGGGTTIVVEPEESPDVIPLPELPEDVPVYEFDIVTYEFNDFLVTRDYSWEPNDGETTYSLIIQNLGNERKVRITDRAVSGYMDLTQFSPEAENVNGNQMTWTETIGEGDAFVVSFTIDGKIGKDRIKSIGAPHIDVIEESEPVAVSPETTETEEGKVSAMTGLVSFASDNAWTGLLAALLVVFAVVIAAVGWVYVEEQGWTLEMVSQVFSNPMLEEDAVSAYEEGTLY